MLSNSWIVGVATGLIATGIIWVLSRFFLSKKDNREYLQSVASANREVIFALRPGISEGEIPTIQVLDALINSTARRYKLPASDLYNPKQISEELVKEVMDSSFLSSTQKRDYCARLLPMGNAALLPELEAEALATAENDIRRNTSAARTRMVEMMSMLLAAMAGVMTATFVILQNHKLPDTTQAFFKTVLTFLLPTLVIALTVFTYSLFSRIKQGTDQTTETIKATTTKIRDLTASLNAAIAKKPKSP